MTELVSVIITAISSSGITGFFTWFFTRKKYNSEVDSQVIDNMKESLEFYKTLSDDNKARLNEVLAQNKSIIEQNDRLLTQNAELLSQNRALQLQIDVLNNKIDKINKYSCIVRSCGQRVTLKDKNKNKQ